MDPNANRFRPVYDVTAEEMKSGLEEATKRALEEELSKRTDRLAELSKGTGRLVLADGTPVPAHWPVFRTGELVTVKDYGFRVAHIGAAHLLLEPTGPLLVGQDKRTVEENPMAGELAWNRRLATERLERARELWNAVAYLTTELSRAIGHQEGHSQPSSTAKEVLRIARVVQEGGPLGHQGELEPEDSLDLDSLDRVSGARTRRELADLRQAREEVDDDQAPVR